MKILIVFDTDNSIFDYEYKAEIARVLARCRIAISHSKASEPFRESIRDTNGNRIGYVARSSQ